MSSSFLDGEQIGTPAMSESADDSYAGKALAGIAWRGASSVGIRLLRVVVFLILARLVAPDAFGTIALALVFITILQHFASGGLSSAIIQHPHLTKSHVDSVFLLSLLAGFVFGGSMLLLAEPVAAIMRQDSLAPVLKALSVMPVLVGISMVPEGWLSRLMDFRVLSIRHMVAAVFSVASALVLAFLGAGVWALVAQTITETAVSCIILWTATSTTYRPGCSANWASVREMVGFGSKVSTFDLTTVAASRGDDLLIGSILGPIALGFYSVAYRLLTVLQETLQGMSGQVAFPLFSRLQYDQDRLRRGFTRSSSLALAISGAVFIYTAAAAPQVVALLLGDSWGPAVPVVAVLAIGGVAAAIMDLNNTFLQAKGKAGQVLVLSAVGAGANVLGFIAAVHYGIFWVAMAFTIRAYLFLPISIYLVARELSGSILALLKSFAPTSAILVVPAASGVLCRFLDAATSNEMVAISVSGILGTGAFLLAARLVAPGTYRDFLLLIDQILGKRLRWVPSSTKEDKGLSETSHRSTE
jgi:O-antigen/teichoic acid export membrane protein